MMPVVCSLAPALDFFSSTMTLSPANAAARAQASPAKLAPTTSRSTCAVEIRPPAIGGAEVATAESGELSRREKELETSMGELTCGVGPPAVRGAPAVSYAMCARREACVN